MLFLKAINSKNFHFQMGMCFYMSGGCGECEEAASGVRGWEWFGGYYDRA